MNRKVKAALDRAKEMYGIQDEIAKLKDEYATNCSRFYLALKRYQLLKETCPF